MDERTARVAGVYRATACRDAVNLRSGRSRLLPSCSVRPDGWPVSSPSERSRACCTRTCPVESRDRSRGVPGLRYRSHPENSRLRSQAVNTLVTKMVSGRPRHDPRRPARIISAPRSAIISTGKLVLPDVIVGMIDASTTHRRPTPHAAPNQRSHRSTIFWIPAGSRSSRFGTLSALRTTSSARSFSACCESGCRTDAIGTS